MAQSKCQELMTLIKGSDETFTTRVIDSLIHNHKDMFSLTPIEKLIHHKQIQAQILDIAQGCEKQIFNDAKVAYPFRKHFNGVTGTMSNILTSGYFQLYNTLLQSDLGIEVSPLDDLKTLFVYLMAIPTQQNHYLMDGDDFITFQQILQLLRSQVGEIALFSSDWFFNYIEFLENSFEDALSQYTYIQNKPNQQTFSQIVEWKLSKSSEKNKKDISTLFYYPSFEHSLYEYYPPYVNPNWRNQLMTDYIHQVKIAYLMFYQPSKVSFLQTPSLPLKKKQSLQTKNKKNKRRGGSRKNFRKRDYILSGL